jgi:hypothetical protein
MKKRLFDEGLITTILGIAMLVLAAVMYTVGKPMEEIVILAGWGFTFLRAKNSLIGLPNNFLNILKK